MSRPETGPMQFGDDWPGVFIRGDNAMGYAMHLDAGMKHMPDGIGKEVVRGLLCELMSAHHAKDATKATLVEVEPPLHFVCPGCGPGVAADEDGCCAMCGEDCSVELKHKAEG